MFAIWRVTQTRCLDHDYFQAPWAAGKDSFIQSNSKVICVRNKDMKKGLEAKLWAKLQKHWATHYSLIISFATREWQSYNQLRKQSLTLQYSKLKETK